MAVDESTAPSSAVESVRDSNYAPTRVPAITGACTAAGYAAVGVVAGWMLGKWTTTAPVGDLVYGLAVGVRAAVAAAHY